MADVLASAQSDNMALLVGNSGGGIMSLPGVNVWSGRARWQLSRIVLASQDYDAQTGGFAIQVARLPLYASLLAVIANTDTSLGSTTIAFGDSHTGNGAIYGAAATLTSTNVATRMGPPTAAYGVPITTGYDGKTGNVMNSFMPQKVGDGGALYEDILMFLGVADLPASGNLVIGVEYLID